MRAVVTGASGFIGLNLVEALRAENIDVLAADQRRSPVLDGLGVEFAEIDVLDVASLRTAFDGSQVVFHLAAMISIVGDPTGLVHRVNVEGPRNATRAAIDAGVDRFVHCSSVHAFDLETCGPSLDETGPRATGGHVPAYDASKNAGESQVQEAVREGLDAVIVNPTGVIGPNDRAPSRMGETLQQLRDGDIPVNVGGGFDFVDVRDVVLRMIAAMRHGRTGENYLLSGTRVSIKELGELVGRIAGVRPPRVNMPIGLIWSLAPLVLRLTPADKIPLFTPDSLHALKYSPSVSHYKAACELGYTARPIHTTVSDTLEWFQRHEGDPLIA